MHADDQTRFDILALTAKKRFTGWEVRTGMNQTAVWVKVSRGTAALQINMPLDVPLDEFEAEAWKTVKKAQEDFLLTGENTD